MLTFESASVLGISSIVEKLAVRPKPVPTVSYQPQGLSLLSSYIIVPCSGLISITVQGLPFQKVKHQVATLDAQPTPNNGVLILVTGQLLVRRFPALTCRVP
jgi:hypothetical protein